MEPSASLQIQFYKFYLLKPRIPLYVCVSLYIKVLAINNCLTYMYASQITKYCLGDQVKQDEMDRTCSMHRGDEKCIQNFNQKVQRPLGKCT